MTELTPSQRVMERFVPWMAEQGFSYRKTGHKFTRATACASYEFSVVFDGRGGLVSTDAAIYVDFPKLRKLYELDQAAVTGRAADCCSWARSRGSTISSPSLTMV